MVDPTATYRLQLRREFGFDQAAQCIEYLADLGISHVYLSPFHQASSDSTHGYDVVNPHEISKDLGGWDAFLRLDKALKEHHLRLLADIVPNHMGMELPQNAWWWDVLAKGRQSEYAAYFDIDWTPSDPTLQGKVVLPVLLKDYLKVLEDGEIQVEQLPEDYPIAGGRFVIRYQGRIFPLSLESQEEITRITEGDLSRITLDTLNSLLEKQNYQFEDWRRGRQNLNYRRFFAIDKMIALNIQDEKVLADVHALDFRLLDKGMIDHLRVDHPDGLRYPGIYFARLRCQAPDSWIVAEKILDPHERLPDNWPIDGTTGYEFLAHVNGLFVDQGAEEALTCFYKEFTGEVRNYAEILIEKKHQVLRELFDCDMTRLLDIIASDQPLQFTRPLLNEAMSEIAAHLPIYRTYLNDNNPRQSDGDLAAISSAVDAAKASKPDIPPDLFDYLHNALSMRIDKPIEMEFALRFQQLTPALAAKGGEDTAFYCYNRLISLNEVGSNPSQFGTPVEEFHDASAHAQARWPKTMLASSTHDTKRSEDVRARIDLLSEIPGQWIEAVWRWSAMNAQYRAGDIPDRNTEYLLYQTLVGGWPMEIGRAQAYMVKTTREASVYTSWEYPSSPFEKALEQFIEGIYGDREFQMDLSSFSERLVMPGRISSLSQTLLKLTSPGIPDIYQGTEIWDLSMVDPDNRRPVDFELRQRLLRETKDADVERVWRRIDEGLPKLWLIKKILDFRHRLPALFGSDASYSPLWTSGAKAKNAIAFMRGDATVTIAPRLVISLGDDWQDTAITLPDVIWENVLTGELHRGGRILIGDLTKRFPVVFLYAAENV